MSDGQKERTLRLRPSPLALVALLAAVHLTLAMGFALVVPWRTPGTSNGIRLPDIGAPDESAHANYVDQILKGRPWPILETGVAVRPEQYEDHQPPLFYALDAAFGSACGLEETASSRAGIALRGLNVMIGASTVFAAFLLGLWATDRARVGVATAAVVALLPMNVALSGAVSNDPLLIALSMFTLALGVRSVRDPSLATALGIGALTGFAILTKFTGLLLIATFPFVLRGRRNMAAAFATTALIALPLFVRNQTVYHHPLATPAFNATFPPTVDLAALRTPRGFVHWLYVLLAGTAVSAIGEFGYMDISLPYAIVVPALAMALFGLLRGAGESLPSRFRAASWVFLGLVAASYLGFNVRYVQPQARYLFPAIGVIALVCVLGLAKDRLRPLVGILLATLFVGDLYALATLPAQFVERVGSVDRR